MSNPLDKLESRSVGRIAAGQFRHDLHFRASSFQHTLEHRLTSLRPAMEILGRRALAEKWEGMSFEDIVADVKAAVGAEIDRQLKEKGDTDAWRDELLACFERVEYTVNTRLLHTLAGLPGDALHALVEGALGVQLQGSVLAVDPVDPDNPKRSLVGFEDVPGRRSYHVAQHDGLLVGDGAVVSLELKTTGAEWGDRKKGTKFDAAQLAKHAWMLTHIRTSGFDGHQVATLVLLPQGASTGRYKCHSSDVRVPDGEPIEIRGRGNRPLGKFRGVVGWSRDDAKDAVGQAPAGVCSFERFAELGHEVLEPMMGPDAEPFVRELERVAETSQPRKE